MSKKTTALAATMMLLIAGCQTAPPSSFLYTYPGVAADSAQGRVVLLDHVTDARLSGLDIDKAITPAPCSCVDTALKAELESTGLFEGVIFVDDVEGAPVGQADVSQRQLRMRLRLTEFTWFVPDYEKKRHPASTGQGGALGAMMEIAIHAAIWGTDTDVLGRTAFDVELIDLATEEVLLDKAYVGETKFRTKISECDSNETKSRTVALATEDAMLQLKQDLEKMFHSSDAGPETVSLLM